MQDELGNIVMDGDWIAFQAKTLIRGQIMWVSEGGLAITSDGQKSPAFLNLVIQVAPDQATGKLMGVHKIFPPPQPAFDDVTATRAPEQVHG